MGFVNRLIIHGSLVRTGCWSSYWRNDFGLDDEFIKEVGETVEPGHSALFLLVSEITPDKVLDDVKRYNPKVLRTSLSQEDEAKLKEAFASEGE